MARKSFTFRKVLCTLLTLVLCIGALNVTAFAAGPFPIDKTANGLDANDQTDVTLSVPGTSEGNWTWQATAAQLEAAGEHLLDLAQRSGRAADAPLSQDMLPTVLDVGELREPAKPTAAEEPGTYRFEDLPETEPPAPVSEEDAGRPTLVRIDADDDEGEDATKIDQ